MSDWKRILVVALVLASGIALYLLNSSQDNSDVLEGGDQKSQTKDAPRRPAPKSQPAVNKDKGPSQEESQRPVAGPPITRISGIVIDALNRPVPNATVDLALLAWRPGQLPSDAVHRTKQPNLRTTKTDVDGRFQFAPQTLPLEMWITARDQTGTMSGQLRCSPVRIMKGIRIRIFKGSTVKGEVKDEGGQPIPGLSIAAFHTEDWNPKRSRELVNGNNYALTDKDGKFTLRGLQPGSLYMRVIDKEWILENSATFRLGENQSIELNLLALKGLKIEGIVLDKNRAPICEAHVLIKPQRGSWRDNTMGGTALSDSTGHFAVGGLQPGTYIVLIQGGFRQTRAENGDVLRRVVVPGRYKKKNVSAGDGNLEVIYDTN